MGMAKPTLMIVAGSELECRQIVGHRLSVVKKCE
jgi:hypothetical protein